MTDDLTILHFIPVLPGIIFLVVGLIAKKFPAKNINPIYGFRTLSAKKGQEQWDYAQEVGATTSITVGVTQILVGLFVGYTVANEVFPVAYLLVSTAGCAIFVATTTEQKVRKRFTS
jgi:uncharacterized membrane protein